MDCYHQTSHQQPTAKVTRIHTYLCAQPHLGYHSISTTATSSLLETLTKTASCSPSSVSATLRPIHPCHPTPQRLPILLDSPLSPTPWVVAPRAAGAWGTRWRAPRQGTRIVPSVWLAAGPVVQDLACCAALVNASVGIPYHVRRASRKRSLPHCSLLYSLPAILPPATARRTLPTLRTGCKIVHARVRWLGRKGVIEIETDTRCPRWISAASIPGPANTLTFLCCLLACCNTTGRRS